MRRDSGYYSQKPVAARRPDDGGIKRSCFLSHRGPAGFRRTLLYYYYYYSNATDKPGSAVGHIFYSKTHPGPGLSDRKFSTPETRIPMRIRACI